MKYLQSATFRALSSLCIGALLYCFPNETTNWLVILVGILFLIPGLISLVAYFRLRSGSETMRPLFPIIGIGSIFFGLILIMFASFFVYYIKYVLAAFLCLAGISQIVSLLRVKKLAHISAVFFFIPLVISLAGIFIFFNVIKEPKWVSCYIGIVMLVYGVMELLSAIVFRRERKALATPAKERVVSEDYASIGESLTGPDSAQDTDSQKVAESKDSDSSETLVQSDYLNL